MDHLPGHLVKNIWFYLCGPCAPFIYPYGKAGELRVLLEQIHFIKKVNHCLVHLSCCFLHSVLNVFVLVS